MATFKPIAETSIENLRIEQTRLRQGLVARNTRVAYEYDWQMFLRWTIHRGLQALPCEPETLALYLTDLLVLGKKITTVRRRRVAIVYQHRVAGFPSPSGLAVKELLHGCQRLRAEKPRQMRPISVRELRRMSIALASLGTPTAIRNRAILVIGYASALRRSNLVALTLADIEFVRQGLIISVQREKQDKKGEGRMIGVVRGRHATTDPVRVLRAWLRVRGMSPGVLFPRLSTLRKGAPLDGECVCRLVKKCLTLISIDPIQSGAHSLRSGSISTMGDANVTALRISGFTGQSPEMVRRYFRRSELWRNNPGVSLGL